MSALPPTDEQLERDAFEAWAKRATPYAPTRNEAGFYVVPHLRSAWVGWMAALAWEWARSTTTKRIVFAPDGTKQVIDHGPTSEIPASGASDE